MDWFINRILPGFFPILLWAQFDSPFQPDFIDDQQLTSEELSALESYFENPLNLNLITSSELWFMDDSLAAIVVNERDARPYHSWQDLARRTKFPESTIQDMKLIFYLPAEKHYRGDWSSRIISNGEDERIRTRLNRITDDWFVQWILQRDPGEFSLTDLSALSLKFQSGPATFLLGSQRFDWGAGLLMSKVYSPRRGPALLRPAKDIMRIRPGYSSMNSGALRGASLGIQLDKLTLFAGAGFHETDVMLTSDGFSRIVPYRIHSHPSSQQYEFLPWIAVCTALKQIRVGLFAGEQNLLANSSLPGSKNMLQSIALTQNYIGATGTWQLQYEAAWQNLVGKRTLNGQLRATQAKLIFQSDADSSGNRLRLSLIYRSYPYAWTPIRGKLFGRHVGNGNERGLYIGWQWSKNPLSLNGHLDCFQQILSNASDFMPQKGWESGIGGRLNTKIGRMRFSYRHREEEVDILTENSDGLIINSRSSLTTHYGRITYTCNLSERLSVRTHAAINRDQGENERGAGNTIGSTLGYQTRSKIVLSTGAYLYRTDGWDQRIGIYEKGLPGEFNFRHLSGSGIRTHTCLTVPMERGTLSVRYAQAWEVAESSDQSGTDLPQLGVQIDIAL